MYACEAELFAAIEKMEAQWDAREKELREKEQKAAAELNPDAKPKPPSERELYDMEMEKLCKNFQKLLPKLMPDHCDCSPEFQEILKKDGYMCCAAAAKAAGLDVGVPDPPKPDSESPEVSPPHGLDDLFHESMYKYHLPEPPRKRKSNESITEEEATTIKSTGAVPKTTINRSELPVKRINKQVGCSSEPLKKKVKKEHSEGKIVLEIDLDCEFSMENIQKYRSNTVREDPFPSGICLTNQIMLTKQFYIPEPLPMVANALDIKKSEPLTALKIDDNVDPQDEQLPDYSQCKTPPCTPAKLQPEEGEPQDEESPGYPECETRPCTPFELQPEEGDPQDEESPGYSQWEIRPGTPFELQPEEGDPQDEESPGYSQWEIRPCTPFELQPEEGDPQDEESPGYSQWEIRPCTPFELQPEEGDPQDEESPGYSQWETRPGTPFELQPVEGQGEETLPMAVAYALGLKKSGSMPTLKIDDDHDPQVEQSPRCPQCKAPPCTPVKCQPEEGQGEEALPMAVAYALGVKKSGSMPTLKIDDDHDPQVEAPPCTPAKLQPEEDQGEGGWLSPPVVVDDGRLDLLSSSIPEHNAIIEKMLDKNPVGRFYWD